MGAKPVSARTLGEMHHGEEGVLFLLLVAKEEMTTRDGNPYWRVTFRDAQRDVSFPIWSDSPWAEECRDHWTAGRFYKLRAVLKDTSYGPQLEIRRIREVREEDYRDGFDPSMCRPRSRFDSNTMFAELTGIVRERIATVGLRALTLNLLTEHRDRLLSMPAARRHHHAYTSGLLEHTLSVARTAAYLADKYDEYYPDLRPRLNKELVVAGAILHDIGKLRELQETATGAEYTASGELIGHILQGRDMIREAAVAADLDPQMLLRLEHIIVSHQRLPEWGAPKPPMTPEALLVHYADDIDAKYHMVYTILRESAGASIATNAKNLLNQKFFLGEA